MVRLFRHKKEKILPTVSYVHNDNYMGDNINMSQSRPINNSDCKLVRLMELIDSAINTWAVEYHLENLPKEIIFGQAFDAMRIIESTISRKNT